MNGYAHDDSVLLHPEERVLGVLLGGDLEAILTSIEIRATATLVANPRDRRFAKVASRIVKNWLGCWPWSLRTRGCGMPIRVAIPFEYSVHDDATGLMDLKE